MKLIAPRKIVNFIGKIISNTRAMYKRWLVVMIVAVLFSTCTKQTHDVPYEQKSTFFERIDSLQSVFGRLNGTLANEALLNSTIVHFKDFDNKSPIVPLIENKYGKAYWDVSLVLQDKNGTFTLVTPIINAQNKVTALLFGSERNKDYTFFRLIDRNIPQTHLAEHGDRAATLFTKATLYGIFNALESNWEQIIHSAVNTTGNMRIATMGNTRSEMYVASVANCWDYSYTYVEAGYNSVTVNIRQCQTNAMYIDNGTTNSVGTGLGATTPVHSGGARGGSTGPTEIMLLDDIKIQLKDPCLLDVWNTVYNNDFSNDISKIINQVFGVSNKFNLTIVEVAELRNDKGEVIMGHAVPPSLNSITGEMNITLQLNSTTNATKEALAATIFHEVLHAYFFTLNISGSNIHHNLIANDFVTMISLSLQKSFPNLTLFQATALAWGGLMDNKYNAWNTLSPDIQEAYLKENGYQEAGQNGTKCN